MDCCCLCQGAWLTKKCCCSHAEKHRLFQVAVAFAEMHDTPVRMVAKGVLNGIVPWQQARTFLAARLKRR